MPAKNSVKQYIENGYYHIYNRGVEKRIIFTDQQDYKTFLSFLKLYLTQPKQQGRTLLLGNNTTISVKRAPNNFTNNITLLSYCLMPNHYHFMIHQKNSHTIASFMQSLMTKYTTYFNKRHHRVGGLFQGKYKAVHITNEYQYVYLTKYIHRNPLSLPEYKNNSLPLSHYPYSSYPNYLKKFSQSWVNTDEILSRFSNTNQFLSYQSFVENSEPDDIKIISSITLDL